MSLRIKKITCDFEDMEKLTKLNIEAFPEGERMPVSEMFSLIHGKKIEVTALYDEKEFVGFYALAIRKTIGYILFLAICSEKRSKGYGSKALFLMKEQYANYQLALDMEIIDETAENIEQRKARKKFYLKNGFYETGFIMRYQDLIMEVLCNEDIFDSSNFKQLLDNLKIKDIPFQLIYAKN